MRVMFALTLVLLCMTAGVTYAQDLQNTLTQPAGSDTFVPEIVSTICRPNNESSIVRVLTATVVDQRDLSQSDSGIMYACVRNAESSAGEWLSPPPVVQYHPAEDWNVLLANKQEFQSMLVTPEPGSFLVLATGLGGLVTWRLRSKSR